MVRIINGVSSSDGWIEETQALRVCIFERIASTLKGDDSIALHVTNYDTKKKGDQ